jgi:hypothetical protein
VRKLEVGAWKGYQLFQGKIKDFHNFQGQIRDSLFLETGYDTYLHLCWYNMEEGGEHTLVLMVFTDIKVDNVLEAHRLEVHPHQV